MYNLGSNKKHNEYQTKANAKLNKFKMRSIPAQLNYIMTDGAIKENMGENVN